MATPIGARGRWCRRAPRRSFRSSSCGRGIPRLVSSSRASTVRVRRTTRHLLLTHAWKALLVVARRGRRALDRHPPGGRRGLDRRGRRAAAGRARPARSCWRRSGWPGSASTPWCCPRRFRVSGSAQSAAEPQRQRGRQRGAARWRRRHRPQLADGHPMGAQQRAVRRLLRAHQRARRAHQAGAARWWRWPAWCWCPPHVPRRCGSMAGGCVGRAGGRGPARLLVRRASPGGARGPGTPRVLAAGARVAGERIRELCATGWPRLVLGSIGYIAAQVPAARRQPALGRPAPAAHRGADGRRRRAARHAGARSPRAAPASPRSGPSPGWSPPGSTRSGWSRACCSAGSSWCRGDPGGWRAAGGWLGGRVPATVAAGAPHEDPARHRPLPAGLGGIETHVASLAERQAARHDVTVLTSTPRRRRRADRDDSGRVHVVRARSLLEGLRTDVDPFDLVHAHISVVAPFTAPGHRVFARRGVPTVVTVHSLWNGMGPFPRWVAARRAALGAGARGPRSARSRPSTARVRLPSGARVGVLAERRGRAPRASTPARRRGRCAW